MNWVWLICLAIAAILNALMDRVENENYSSSVFKNLNPKFWYKRESWKDAKKIGRWKFDAWHCAKSLMLVFICLAIVFYKPLFNWWGDFAIAGVEWILVFNIFYNTLFKA